MADDHQLAAVQSAAEQLALLGGTRPRVIPEPGATRIEIEVTGRLADHWPQVLDVLNQGADFGLTLTHTGQTAWLRIERETGTHP